MKSITVPAITQPLLSVCWHACLSLLLPDKPRRGRHRSAASSVHQAALQADVSISPLTPIQTGTH